MADVPSTGAGELPLMIGALGAAHETLMLVSAPDDAGIVHVRSWSAEDWSAPPRLSAERARVLLDWLEVQVKSGRSMNQSPYAVRLWLRGEGSATR